MDSGDSGDSGDSSNSRDSEASVQQLPTTTEQPKAAVKSAKEFWEASRGTKPELWYKFKRFESLALLNLYLYQDELVQLQHDIDYKDGNMLIEQRTSLRALIKDYYEAMQLFKQTSQLKRPIMADRTNAIESLQSLTQEPHRDHYRFAADALGMVDLTPQALGVEPDAIRVLLGGFRFFHANTDDTLANYPDDVEARRPPASNGNAPDQTPANSGDNARTGPSNSGVRHWLRPIPVGAITDNVARFIMAVFTGVLLLVPVIALSYINPTGYRLLATCLFVLAFAVIVSVGITSTTNELVGATAAYAAVLVVFLGQTSPPHG